MKYKYMYIVRKMKWEKVSYREGPYHWELENFWLFRSKKEADEFIEKIKHTKHHYYHREPQHEYGYTKVCFQCNYDKEKQISYWLGKRRVEGTAE